METAAALMREFPGLWGLAGGWAIDLFLGRATRPHADVDVAVFRQDQLRLREYLAGWTLEVADAGTLAPWAEGEWLAPPRHELHARSAGGDRIEFLLNERTEREWVYRRDPAVRLPIEETFMRTEAGVPFLCPEVVLLYKSKSPRPADEADCRAAAGSLGPERRRWLRRALEATHPGHPWLGRIAPEMP